MIRFLGNIEAKADAKGRVFIPANSDGNYSPALKTSSSCAKTYFKTAWCFYPEEGLE